VLYILILDGPSSSGWTLGTNYYKIVAANGPSNGLGMPVAVDTNGDGTVDAVYAGDLQGNLWKFDLSSTSPSAWGVAFGGAPLFSAKSATGVAQPITTQPLALPSSYGGWVIGFGTGKLYLTSDATTTATQTIYGIRDNGSAVAGRSVLQQQTFTSTFSGTDAAATTTFRLLSNNTVCYTTAITGCTNHTLQQGWYVDLPSSGERVAISAGDVYFGPAASVGAA